MRVLEGFYYTIYRWLLKTSMKDIAKYMALTIMAFLFFVNFVIISKKIGLETLQVMSAKAWSALIIVPLIVIFYFLFVANKRYQAIIEHYAHETKQQRLTRNLVVLGYVLLTFIVLLIK